MRVLLLSTIENHIKREKGEFVGSDLTYSSFSFLYAYDCISVTAYILVYSTVLSTHIYQKLADLLFEVIVQGSSKIYEPTNW